MNISDIKIKPLAFGARGCNATDGFSRESFSISKLASGAWVYFYPGEYGGKYSKTKRQAQERLNEIHESRARQILTAIIDTEGE